MNKNQAMKEMIDGKKIIDTTKTGLHYYVFENGRFMFVMSDTNRVIANMPEHNNYEVFFIKKTVHKVVWITPAASIQIKNMEDGFPVNVSHVKTTRACLQARISWEEAE